MTSTFLSFPLKVRFQHADNKKNHPARGGSFNNFGEVVTNEPTDQLKSLPISPARVSSTSISSHNGPLSLNQTGRFRRNTADVHL